MRMLVFVIRKVFKFGSVTGLFVVGCASGPITTQINTKKNPVVKRPSQFQSPILSTESFLEAGDNKILSDSLSPKIRTKALKTLLNQQARISQELKETGKLRLQPGFSYEFDLESFCVNAGIERPVKGDGLFLGDIEGPVKSWLPTILGNYKRKGISQADAQTLVWSLLSKTKFDELNTKNQGQLIKLFPDAPIRFGNSFVENHVTDFLLSQIPSEIISAKEQFEKYQEILQDSQLKYSEMEKILSPVPSRTNALDVGWLKHGQGYYIHLTADGYQQVHVQIYVPEGLNAKVYFEPSKHVVLPGQGQRLALSNNVIDHHKDKANQIIKNKTSVSAKEAEFILKHPLDALKIYEAAQTAIKTTCGQLKSSHNYEDDNTDAYRHFLWSGLVTHAIGAGNAKEYLDAHEDYPDNNPEAKSMDLYNNGKGIDYANKYHGDNFEKDLAQAGLDKIRDRQLRWIK